jgi:hypothetical protein
MQTMTSNTLTTMTLTTMTLTIERESMLIYIGDEPFEVERLGIQLPFARKPANLNEFMSGRAEEIYITETKVLTPDEFDVFARTLLVSRDWLAGKGGGFREGHLCVEVTAPGRPYLYVNPEGGDYARYVARLG